jgi:hypothetical protein
MSAWPPRELSHKNLNRLTAKNYGMRVSEARKRVIHMPRLYNVFDMPKIKAVRATTTLRLKVSAGEILKRISRAHQIRSADKNITKFEIRRGAYLLLFPSGYVEVHARDEGEMREVLIAFRDELFEHRLIK